MKPLPKPCARLCSTRTQMDLPVLLTHLKVTVESDRFLEYTFIQRQRLVWDAIRKSPVLDHLRYRAEFDSLLKTSTIGSSVRSLPYLYYIPIEFSIVCKSSVPSVIRPTLGTIPRVPKSILQRLKVI